MKRIFVSFTIVVVLLICAGAGLTYWALQGQYASTLVNKISQQLALPVSVYDARFQFPNHISLSGVEIEELQDTPLTIEKLDIWITPASLLSKTPTIESLLIDGISLQNGIPDLPDTSGISLKQLAIKNLDFADGELVGRDINLQIEEPQFERTPLLIPYGTIQFSAAQLYWRGEALDSFLIDADYKPQNSTVYGISFDWRESTFSGQAKQEESGWSLVNATINNLRIDEQEWAYLQRLGLSELKQSITHIGNLDLLKSTISVPQFSIINFDLSLENLSVNHDYWNQKDTYISLSSESLNINDQQLIDPIFDARMTAEKITLNEFSSIFQQGNINASGTLTPDSAKLKNLRINGIKWIPDSSDEAQFIETFMSRLNTLDIASLEIKHCQFIQLNNANKWQVSGLNVEGKDLSLIRDEKWGLWNGEADISATNFSVNELLSNHPVARMQNFEGVWELDELFIPLENGLIEATGHYDLEKVSQPWRIELSADGLPIEFLSHWVTMPVKVDGLMEFQLSATALGGDELMFRHSLSSEIAGTFRDTRMKIEEDGSVSAPIPVHLSELKASSDRGVIHMQPLVIEGDSLLGLLNAEIDLVDQENSQFKFKLQQRCKEATWDFLNKSETLSIFCTTD